LKGLVASCSVPRAEERWLDAHQSLAGAKCTMLHTPSHRTRHPMTATHDTKITIADFNQLLETHHPFASVLGIDVLEIGAGTALLRLPDRSSHQRLGGIVAGPMLMGLADLALYAAVVGATGNAEAVTASLSI